MTPLLDRLNSSLANRYEVERTLGQGGMAEVFLARDVKHDRMVAIKVLKPDVSSAVDSLRFLAEIRTVARLSHPHILPLFDSGYGDDLIYYVMPYVGGESLADRIAREGKLPIDDALRIAQEVAGALHHAHEFSVIHRDVKPANVLLSGGHALVADFGIAKALGSVAKGLTMREVGIGTPAYMAPEQMDGRRVDRRADVYGLACTLYEMLAGRTPFSGDLYVLIARHASAQPPSLRTIRPSVTEELDTVILRALEKAPASRFATAREFGQALQGAQTASSIARPASQTVPRSAHRVKELRGAGAARSGSEVAPCILVFPFDDHSPKQDAAYLCDGLADEIITDLARSNAKVISRTSATQAKRRGVGLKTLARKLGVRCVVEGSVIHTGDQLRINVKLVDTETESSLAAEVFKGEMSEILAIQERISAWIANTAPGHLSPPQHPKDLSRQIPDAAAYDLFLRAKHEIFQFTPEALARAERYLQQALGRLGDSTPLLAALGYVYWQYRNAGASADPVYLDRVDACVARIQELDPDSPHADRLSGLVAIQRGDPDRVVQMLTRALDADPNDTDSLFWLTLIHGFRGYPQLTHPMVERLLTIDPLQPMHQFLPGFVALMEGRFADAPEPFRQAVEMDPENPVLRMGWGQALAMAGRRDEAYAVYDQLWKDMPGVFFAELGRFQRLALRGDREGALAAGTTETLAPACEDPQYAWTAAQCFSLLGETRTAVEWLDRAIRHGCGNYPLLARTDPLLETVREDPSFRALMDDLRPRWEALRA